MAVPACANYYTDCCALAHPDPMLDAGHTYGIIDFADPAVAPANCVDNLNSCNHHTGLIVAFVDNTLGNHITLTHMPRKFIPHPGAPAAALCTWMTNKLPWQAQS